MKLKHKIIATEAVCPRCGQLAPMEVWSGCTSVWPYCFFEPHDCKPRPTRIKEASMSSHCNEGSCGPDCHCKPPTQTVSNVGGLNVDPAFSPAQYPPPQARYVLPLEPGQAWLWYDENRTLWLRRERQDIKVTDFNLPKLQAVGEWLRTPPVEPEEADLYALQVMGETPPVAIEFADGRRVQIPAGTLRGVPVKEVAAQAQQAAKRVDDGD